MLCVLLTVPTREKTLPLSLTIVSSQSDYADIKSNENVGIDNEEEKSELRV